MAACTLEHMDHRALLAEARLPQWDQMPCKGPPITGIAGLATPEEE